MPMTNSGRTNTIPLKLLALCGALMLLRAALILYRTYNQPISPAQALVWQAPSAMEPKRRDLLAKPTLYFFCDYSEPFSSMLSKLMAEAAFNNREIVKYMNDNFRLVKVIHTKNDSEEDTKLIKHLHVYLYPTVVITLVNGTKVDFCQWQTDKVFMEFMEDSIEKKRYETIADQSMRFCDFKLACKAYEALGKAHSGTVYRYIALKHEGRNAEAKTLLEEKIVALKNQFHLEPQSESLPKYRYLLGELSEEEFLQAEKNHHSDGSIFSHYLVGEKRLLDGHKVEARQEFRQATAKAERWSTTYRYARAELKALGEKVSSHSDADDDDELD